MLRKGGSVTSINTSGTGPGIGTGTIAGGPAITGLSSSSNSSPLHYHSSSRLHHAHRRPRGESLVEAQQQQRSQYRTSSPSSSSTLEGALHHQHHHRLPTNTLPKRGPTLSSSASDISGGSVFSGGCGGGCLRSPSRQQQQQHQQQHHCCGCACANPPPPPPNKGSISSNTLLRHVVSSNLSSSPTRASSPLLLSSSSPNHNHSPLLLRGDQRDCPVDSHPRLTTATTHNPNHLSRQQLWHFGKEDEIDDEEDCGGGVGAVGGQLICEHERLLRVEEESVGRRGVSCGGGSTSHGYHPSPGLTLPCQGASAHYNAGAITSTPTTSNAGGFAFFKLQNSSSTSVPSPPELLLPMDFIQVLIHQHAKTIVALQDLQREVSTLKDFRTSLLHSLPATGAPTAPTGLSDAVWTTGGGSVVGGSSPPTATPTSSSSGGGGGAPPAASSTTKIPHPDSGFSTETKSTNQKSDAESDDELYSLLSLIQCKVQESIIRNDYLLSSHQNRTATSSHRSSSNRKSGDSTKPKERLGKLDKVLGNCDKVEFRKDFISRDVIRGVLGAEKTELQRQLFFALVKIENLKSVSKEQKTVDSRVYALSQENEQLRYKLKEMEIELEGTKATLRILQKNSYSPSPANNAPLSSKSSSSSSTVLPEASGHTNHPHHHQSRLIVVPPPPHHPAWESDSLDNTDPAEFAIPGTTAVSALPAVGGGGPSPAAASTATRQRLIQKLSDIESISSSNSSPAPAATNNNSRLSNYPYGSSNSSNSSGSGSKKSPAPKPPVIVEHVPTNTSSSGTAPPSSTGKQQKSASPVGNKSMSSIKSNNSSIPIAVSRLKGKAAASNASTPPNNNNNNNNNKVVAGKGKSGAGGGGSSTTGSTGGNGGIGTIWANWFS